MKQRTNSQSGVSQRTGNQWRTDEWLVVIPGQYERRINFEVRGIDRCQQWESFFNGMPDKNAPVLIKFEIDAREYDGRWFNTVQAWDIAITTW
ncbi:MAG: DUF3127 domain-containing protein [Prevotella sp.]|nr:DUF3127 domain-containing protein [Prevotella sp.]